MIINFGKNFPAAVHVAHNLTP